MNKIMVLMPDTSEAQAWKFCQKISRTLQGHPLLAGPEPIKGFGYSVSAGVVEAKKNADLNDLINQSQAEGMVLFQSRQ
jgi:PleD family two-component response regulator